VTRSWLEAFAACCSLTFESPLIELEESIDVVTNEEEESEEDANAFHDEEERVEYEGEFGSNYRPQDMMGTEQESYAQYHHHHHHHQPSARKRAKLGYEYDGHDPQSRLCWKST